MSCINCVRGRNDCVALAMQGSSDVVENSVPLSFVCVGWNSPKSRSVPQDRFTLCWKTPLIDELGHYDKRDLIDTMSVIAQALSIDANIMVNEGLSEEEMIDTEPN